MQLDTVFTEGALVDIDVCFASFDRLLQPEDLGLNPKKLSKAFKLGHKSLMPAHVNAAFRHHDYKARALLNQMSFSFPFGGARFVPKKTLITFAEKMDEVIAAFNKSVEDLITNYEKYKLQMRKAYLNAAKEAYANLTGLGINVESKSKDEFINEFLERVDKFYPNVSEIFCKFKIDYQVFQMALPDLSQASYEDIATESTKIKMLEDAYKAKIHRKINEFIYSLVGELRSKAERVLKIVETNIQDSRRYTAATHRMLKEMIESYGDLNIIDDKSFQQDLEDFKTTYLTFNPKYIRETRAFQLRMLESLKILTKRVLDQAEIQQLAEAYKNKVKV